MSAPSSPAVLPFREAVPCLHAPDSHCMYGSTWKSSTCNGFNLGTVGIEKKKKQGAWASLFPPER